MRHTPVVRERVMTSIRGGARKATFSLSAVILNELNQAVAHGAARSKNAFVERALERELAEVKRATETALLEEASRDPLFLKDLEEIEIAFRSADAETARAIG